MNGSPINYQEFHPEAAQTVVFLHGGNVAGWMWEPQITDLADYHCLALDLPGYGAGRAQRWENMAAVADQVADLIRGQAHGGRAHVVGLSLGAVLGAHLAARHPHEVRSAFLAGGPLAKAGPLTKLLLQIQLKAWDYRWFWNVAGRGYGMTGQDLELFTETALGVTKDNRERIFPEVYAGFPVDVLAAISTPVLYVAGGKDAKIVKASLPMAARHIPGAKVAVAPGMHHQWSAEDSGLFNRSLRVWLAEGRVSGELNDAVDGIPGQKADVR